MNNMPRLRGVPPTSVVIGAVFVCFFILHYSLFRFVADFVTESGRETRRDGFNKRAHRRLLRRGQVLRSAARVSLILSKITLAVGAVTRPAKQQKTPLQNGKNRKAPAARKVQRILSFK